MLPFFAVLVALACVAASIRRLRWAIAPTKIDPMPLVHALRGDVGRSRFEAMRRVLADELDADWERELAHAFDKIGEQRTARINELLGDLDHMVQAWARVPRVCASIAASSGFLLASLALRNGLTVAGDLPLEVQDFAIHQAVRDGIDVAAIGICGAVTCITIGYRATKAAKARLVATDQLVERMEALAGSESGSGREPEPEPDSDSESGS